MYLCARSVPNMARLLVPCSSGGAFPADSTGTALGSGATRAIADLQRSHSGAEGTVCSSGGQAASPLVNTSSAAPDGLLQQVAEQFQILAQEMSMHRNMIQQVSVSSSLYSDPTSGWTACGEHW